MKLSRLEDKLIDLKFLHDFHCIITFYSLYFRVTYWQSVLFLENKIKLDVGNFIVQLSLISSFSHKHGARSQKFAIFDEFLAKTEKSTKPLVH